MKFFRAKNKAVAEADSVDMDQDMESGVPAGVDVELRDEAPDMQATVTETVADSPDGRCEVVLTETPAPGKLRTDNLVKRYGKRTVANHVSIEVSQGEIVGLLGPNGAGKTTTFYMTVGLISVLSSVSGIWLRRHRCSGSCRWRIISAPCSR